MTQIALEAQKYLRLKQRILEQDDAVDDETLADTLEGLTNLHEVILAVSRGIALDEAHVEGLRLYLKDLQERVARIEARAKKHRMAVRDAMVEAGLKQLVAPDLTLSIRTASPGLIVTDESEIPTEFWEPQPPKLSRWAVLSALKRGTRIPGAELAEAIKVLAVRIK